MEVTKPSLVILSSATTGGAGRLSKLLSILLPTTDIQVEFSPQSQFGLRKPTSFREVAKLLPVMALAAFDKWVIKKSSWKSEFSLARSLWSQGDLRGSSSGDIALVRYGAGYVSNRKLIVAGFERIIIGLPDELALTGGCHYALECEQYLSGCYSCPAVRPVFRSLVAANFRRKLKTNYQLKDRLDYVYPSTGMKDKFARSPIGLLSSDSPVIGHPLGEEYLKSASSRQRNATSNKILVTTVAENLDDPVKGVEYILYLSLALADKASFTLVGNASRRLRRRGRGSGIHFTGTLEGSDLIERVNESDLFLVSSHGEFFGSAALQALSLGVPVLARANTGTAAMCRDLGVEFIFEDYDHLEKMLSDGVRSKIEQISQVLVTIDWKKRNSDSIAKYRELLQK